MRHLEVEGLEISCGISQVYGFGEYPRPFDEEKQIRKDLEEAIRDTFNADEDLTGEMMLCSLNEHQWNRFESLIKEYGFKQAGRTHTNRNSGNKIRLYLLQRGDEKLP